ncbi:MAG: hypothetical protein DWI57_04560 [Chloroflexi bacterium]|nr:MAG: hypothetical protein DWI57_04560 [Chloroflexota bacterium]
MAKENPSDPAEVKFTTAIVVTAILALLVFLLCVGYFLGLAWLLTLLAPLTYPQAAAFSFLVVASSFLILARLPRFNTSLIILAALAFAALAVIEALLSRLVAFITPLSGWEAALLTGATAALLMFIVAQTVLDNSEFEEPDDEDEWEASTVARRLSPDMYVLRPRETEMPAPHPPRAQRRRSKRKTDDTETN